jgi:hypothetical protein
MSGPMIVRCPECGTLNYDIWKVKIIVELGEKFKDPDLYEWLKPPKRPNVNVINFCKAFLDKDSPERKAREDKYRRWDTLINLWDRAYVCMNHEDDDDDPFIVMWYDQEKQGFESMTVEEFYELLQNV